MRDSAEGTAQPGSAPRVVRPIIRAGLFAGAGLGGFFDGIVFHQLLQTHSMVSGRLPRSTVAELEVHMFWDGVFHAAVWVMTLIGLVLLFRAREVRGVFWSGKALAGGMFMGWGLFNLIEGLIDHHVLHLHHVIEARGESIFDGMFLGSGVLLVAVGWYLCRLGRAPREDLRTGGTS